MDRFTDQNQSMAWASEENGRFQNPQEGSFEVFSTIPGSCPKGRPKTRWSDVIRKDFDPWKLNDCWRKSTNREVWCQIIFEAGPGPKTGQP